MNTPTRVAAFAAGLAAVFAAAVGVGTLTGSVGVTSTSSSAEPAGHTETSGPGTTTGQANAGALPGGLMVSQDGYTLELARRQLPAAAQAPLQFRILGPAGRPVTRYTTAHGKDLHLIVVRRDLTDFQHVHPQLDASGTWNVPLNLSDPGVYRVFADFTPADRGDNLTLGADLFVPGDYSPRRLPDTTRTADVDGYTVTLEGNLEPGKEVELTLSVSRHGAPVTDLQPYLAAYGHLVALRDRDLAYLHVHPAGSPGDGKTESGPGITFSATVPSAGDYRLFLDFRHDSKVRTAGFTVTARPGDGTEELRGAGQTDAPTPSASTTIKAGDGHGGHGG
jgi:hypothetical protein